MSLLIRNVKIASSEGAVPERGDVFISGKRISAIGDLRGKRAAEVIDGQGAWLAPGCIDAETTADRYGALFEAPYHAMEHGQQGAAREGITTVIGGHCGLTLADLHAKGIDLAHALRVRKLAPNFMTLAGSSIRSVHLDDLSETGLRETKKAIKKGEYGSKIFFPHILPPHARAKDAERIRVFLREAGAYANIRAGVSPAAQRVWEVGELLPEHMRGVRAGELKKALADSWSRERLLRELPELHPERLTVLEVPGNPLLRNVPFTDLLSHYGLSDVREGILLLMKASGLRATLLEAGEYPRLAQGLLEDERVFLGTHAPYPVERRNPFLTALRGLMKRGLSFPSAMQKLAAAPALFFGIRERGVIREGLYADLVLFTPAVEVRAVIVNGTIAARDGASTGATAGQYIAHP